MDTSKEKIIIGAVVNNHPGVLMRVTELFTKRCYNIDSLEVGVTDNPAISRMTIVATGDAQTGEQIVKQLSKLHDVRRAAIIPRECASVREHMLVKLRVTPHASATSNTNTAPNTNAAPNTSAALTSMVNAYGAKVIDFSADSVTAEVTGEMESNDAFIAAARDFGILEVCRAGAQALHRGTECL